MGAVMGVNSTMAMFHSRQNLLLHFHSPYATGYPFMTPYAGYGMQAYAMPMSYASNGSGYGMQSYGQSMSYGSSGGGYGSSSMPYGDPAAMSYGANYGGNAGTAAGYAGSVPNPGSGLAYEALPKDSGNKAVIEIKVPLALAEVIINGHVTQQTGLTRTFMTPELQAGKTATYTVQANWSESGWPKTQTRSVQVTAGQSVTVDFTHK